MFSMYTYMSPPPANHASLPPAALAALGDPSKLPSGAPHLNPAFLQDMAQGGNMVRGGREGEMG